MRSLALIILALVTAAGLNGCNSEHKPSYEELETENEELHAKLSAALEHVEEAENHLNDLKSEIAEAEGDASAYRICEDAEDAITNADSYADEIQSSLDDAKNELE
jgi:hypothetical protein